MLCVATVFGQDNFSNQTLRYDLKPDERYQAHELSFDAFEGVTLGESSAEQSRSLHNARLGSGLGMNYFFHRNLGVEAEGFSENSQHSFVDTASGSLVFRVPVGGSGLAAYAFGGAGYQFDHASTSTLHTGAGIEYRFNSHVGLFLEPRVVFRTRISNYGFGRGGMRVIF